MRNTATRVELSLSMRFKIFVLITFFFRDIEDAFDEFNEVLMLDLMSEKFKN